MYFIKLPSLNSRVTKIEVVREFRLEFLLIAKSE